MALNYPGPYEIRLFYSVGLSSVTLTHSARYNLILSEDPDPGTSFGEITAVTHDLDGTVGVVALDTWIDTWVAAIDGMYAASCSIDYAELWAYEASSFEASFVSSYAIGVAGNGAGTNQSAGQVIMTFRTREGGILKLNLMETNVASGVQISAAALTGTLGGIANIVAGDGNVWIGRDTSAPFAVIAAYPGQNEALFKRRFRAS